MTLAGRVVEERDMKRLLWITWIVTAVALAQPPALRQGIRVEMALTNSAAPMREADQAGARIVAVTRSGDVYLEATPITPAALTEALRAAQSADIFIKADSNAPYARVAAVLGALRSAGDGTANLLTSQRDPTDGADAPPKGIRVSLGELPDSREKVIVLDAAGPLLFGDVVRILDASRAAGAKVVLK
jgi:biopolymer transport protein ExbD